MWNHKIYNLLRYTNNMFANARRLTLDPHIYATSRVLADISNMPRRENVDLVSQ
jgi:hypothetical protein